MNASEAFQAYLDVPLPGLVHRVVEVAVGIRCLEVDRRGDDSRRQGLARDDSLDTACRAQCVSGPALAGRHGQFLGAFLPEDCFEGHCFELVVVGGRGSVSVYVVHVLL